MLEIPQTTAFVRRSTLLFLSFLLSLTCATVAHAAASRPLRIAFLFSSGTMASLWMAKESGAFAKEGLDVEMISASSALALPALLANEVDVIQISAVPLINASLRGFDVVFIAGMLNTMIWDLTRDRKSKAANNCAARSSARSAPAHPSLTARLSLCASSA